MYNGVMAETNNQGPEALDESMLRMSLEAHGIDTETWGTNATKPVRSLLIEILRNEASLQREGNELVRVIQVAAINVFRPDGKRLVETLQVFKDGATRSRSGDGRYSLSEKMAIGADPSDEALRALEEELGIRGNLRLRNEGTIMQEKESESYPGLHMRILIHSFSVTLPPEHVRETYVEKQADKETHFEWEK